MTPLISVIITTYNWPQALDACLSSLADQQDKHFEIIIADDGSTQETHAVIESFSHSSTIQTRHVFHEDRGFRAGTIRNKASAAATGDYLIFIDGDCIAFPHFISRHRELAEKGHFVPGNRILLSQSFTHQTLQTGKPLHRQSPAFFLEQRLRRHINRVLPLLHLPVHFWRYQNPRQWQKAMTCNLAAWKSDFLAVNGFDESFEGWGYEDSDLVIRLIHQGIKRKEGRFATPVLHLWHPQNDRSRHDENYARLMQRVTDASIVRADKGVEQYLQ